MKRGFSNDFMGATVVAYFNKVFEQKTISLNVLLAMIGVTLFGWIGLGVTIMFGLLAITISFLENYGGKSLFSWGKK